MKPIIGLSTTYTHNDTLGAMLHMGVPEQSYHVCTDDFVRAVSDAGATALMLPTVRTDEERQALLDVLDGIIFCGGADLYTPLYGECTEKICGPVVPEQDLHEAALARLAQKRNLPILGVCRGMQLLNLAFGGTLYQDLPTQKPSSLYHSNENVPREYGVHPLEIRADSLLANLLGESVWVNSFHHQAVKDIAPLFEVCAQTKDGVIEALECPSMPAFLAVQWHPEMMASQNDAQRAIFSWLVSCAKDYSVRK